MRKKDKTPFLLRVVRWFFPKLERIAPSLAHRYFVRVFFIPLRFPTPDKERKAASFAKPFHLSVAGKRIHGYQWGEGAAYVLVVHGWAGRATQFRRFIKPFMNAGFCVVGFDGPAHGLSEGKQTSIHEFEQVLKETIRIKGQPKAILAHSFGGVASLFAVMRGLPVRTMINIASPTIGDEVIRTYLRAINGSWSTGEFFKSYIMETEGRPFDEFSSLYFVKHLPHPLRLLLIHDENDSEVEICHTDAMMQAYPGAKVLRTQKLGHTRILKDDEVIRHAVTFVQQDASDMQ